MTTTVLHKPDTGTVTQPVQTATWEPEVGTLTQPVHGTSWEAEAYQRTLALKDLREHPRRGRAVPPTREAINAALEYIRLAAELPLPSLGGPFIAPLEEGGVQLEWDNGERHVDIELLPDGSAQWTLALSDEFHYGEFGKDPQSELLVLLGWLTATQ